MKKLQDTDPRVQEAIVLYKSGVAVRSICKQLNIDSMTLRRFLNLRTRGEAIRIAKSKATIIDDSLDVLTPEALYWIGFLYADGHIERDRPRISLTLESKDIKHLEKFRDFFGPGLTIRTLGSGYLRVAFSSKVLYERLISLGFSNRKSYNIIPHTLLKSSRDFWRGVVDGDGWLYTTSLSAIGLCGHENTINEFLNFMTLSGLSHKVTCKKIKKRENLWSCDIRAQEVVKKLTTILYKNATVYLDRKYQLYQEFQT